MNRHKLNWGSIALLLTLTFVAGCKKKAPPPPVATAPPVVAPTPTAMITASPTSITAGEQVVLRWNTTGATSVSIEGVGDVSTAGVKTVTPNASTTYHLIARGSGGIANADARVTVSAPPAATAPANTMNLEQQFRANVQDVFFNYDKYDIRTDAQATIVRDASYLASHPDMKIVIGGYCDERGSAEYNLALGQNRAAAVKNALVNAGILSSRIRVISYGKEKPFCTESSESCWQQNRRGGFSLDH